LEPPEETTETLLLIPVPTVAAAVAVSVFPFSLPDDPEPRPKLFLPSFLVSDRCRDGDAGKTGDDGDSDDLGDEQETDTARRSPSLDGDGDDGVVAGCCCCVGVCFGPGTETGADAGG